MTETEPGFLFADVLERLEEPTRLTREEAGETFGALFDLDLGEDDRDQALARLADLMPTAPLLAGAVDAMRARMVGVEGMSEAVDVCGTGGDSLGLVNVSTAAAFVVAGAGLSVAKHGGRAVSSRSGSSDVLAALGLDLSADPERIGQGFTQAGLAFLAAPRHHPAMAGFAGARKRLGRRTLFNLLGPLSNPARPRCQLVGVFAPELLHLFAETLGLLGLERAYVVHGEGDVDEVSTQGPSEICALGPDGAITAFSLSPKDLNLPLTPLSALKGGDARENAEAIDAMLRGEAGALRTAAILNAAAAIHVWCDDPSWLAAKERAEAAIDRGDAHKVLTTLRSILPPSHP
jgi:anthranilate phosphoribosyltransferase